jgi:transcription elongation factor GreA
MRKKFYLTEAGLHKLQRQFDKLLLDKDGIVDDLKTARGYGDLNENSEYISARLALERVQIQLSEIENVIKHAEIIHQTSGAKKISVGTTVELRSEDGNLKQLQLVSTVEADPTNNKISDESPLGQALLDKAQGDSVTLQLPARTAVYTVVSIA